VHRIVVDHPTGVNEQPRRHLLLKQHHAAVSVAYDLVTRASTQLYLDKGAHAASSSA
jgi:hypothetical protein